MIGLIDGNNFFASCERIFDPSLEGKALAVLSNNDGCVISRSNECKALGIPMGAAYFEVKDCPGLVFRSGNYALYGDISRRIIAVLCEFSPDVEQYSIDEAFIHVGRSSDPDYFELGQRIRQTILRWVGIPCGVGFAFSKTLAKIANHIGKKQASGVFVMPENPEAVLSKVPVSDVWGVGRRLAPKLERLGIRTAAQLANSDEAVLRKKFNVILAKTILELRGESVLEEEDPEELSQSISCSRSFGRPVIELAELSEAVSHYIARAAEKLRGEGQRAAGINVYFQYYPEYEPRKREGGFTGTTVSFEIPTSATSEMIRAVLPRLKGIFLSGRRYKKAGVVFFGLEPLRVHQPDLFADSARNERAERASAVMDAINRRFGKGTVFNLAEGIQRPWTMRRGHLSPNYTTNWEQLPEVK